MKPSLKMRVANLGTTAKVLGQAGIVRPYSPVALARVLKAVTAWGTGPAGGFAALAARSPDRVGLIDHPQRSLITPDRPGASGRRG